MANPTKKYPNNPSVCTYKDEKFKGNFTRRVDEQTYKTIMENLQVGSMLLIKQVTKGDKAYTFIEILPQRANTNPTSDI